MALARTIMIVAIVSDYKMDRRLYSLRERRESLIFCDQLYGSWVARHDKMRGERGGFIETWVCMNGSVH